MNPPKVLAEIPSNKPMCLDAIYPAPSNRTTYRATSVEPYGADDWLMTVEMDHRPGFWSRTLFGNTARKEVFRVQGNADRWFLHGAETTTVFPWMSILHTPKRLDGINLTELWFRAVKSTIEGRANA